MMSLNLLWLISCHIYLDTDLSFKCFWSVELVGFNTAIYKCQTLVQWKFFLKQKTFEIVKNRHDRLILMFFWIPCPKNIKKHLKHSNCCNTLAQLFFKFCIKMQRFLLHVQQNPDVVEKNRCQILIQRSKNIENDHTHHLCISKFFCNSV